MKHLSTLLVSIAITATSVLAQDTVKVKVNLTPEQQAEQLYNAGITAYGAHNYDNAIQQFDASLALLATNEKAMYSKALCYFDKREYEQSKQNAALAFKQKPTYDDASLLCAKSCLQLKDTNTAIEWFKATSVANTQNDKAPYNLGVISFMRKNYSEAITYYTQCLTANAQNAYGYNIEGVVIKC